jgi:hypothetical protein
MNKNYGLEMIKKLKPCIFQYKQPDEGGLVDDNNLKHLGFIAQDLKELFPEDEYAVVKKTPSGYLAVDLTELIAPIVKAIQELDEKVEKLYKQMGELNNEDDI